MVGPLSTARAKRYGTRPAAAPGTRQVRIDGRFLQTIRPPPKRPRPRTPQPRSPAPAGLLAAGHPSNTATNCESLSAKKNREGGRFLPAGITAVTGWLGRGEWVSQDKGSLRRPLRVRCRACGEIGAPCDACCHGSSRRRVAELAWSNNCASCSLCFWVGRLRATRCWYVHSSVSACHVASTLLWWQAISVTGTGDALLTRQQLSQT